MEENNLRQRKKDFKEEKGYAAATATPSTSREALSTHPLSTEERTVENSRKETEQQPLDVCISSKRALVLSAICPGLGHIYAYHVSRGVTVFVAMCVILAVSASALTINILFGIVSLLYCTILRTLCAFLGSTGVSIGFWAIVMVYVVYGLQLLDTYMVVQRINDGSHKVISSRLWQVGEMTVGSLLPWVVVLLPVPYVGQILSMMLSTKTINHIRNCVSHRDVHHAEEMINDMLHTFSWALLLQTVTYVATACVLGTYLGVWTLNLAHWVYCCCTAAYLAPLPS